jgi:hypothetical protein
MQRSERLRAFPTRAARPDFETSDDTPIGVRSLFRVSVTERAIHDPRRALGSGGNGINTSVLRESALPTPLVPACVGNGCLLG